MCIERYQCKSSSRLDQTRVYGILKCCEILCQCWNGVLYSPRHFEGVLLYYVSIHKVLEVYRQGFTWFRVQFWELVRQWEPNIEKCWSSLRSPRELGKTWEQAGNLNPADEKAGMNEMMVWLCTGSDCYIQNLVAMHPALPQCELLIRIDKDDLLLLQLGFWFGMVFCIL